jgi:hypothetical protein
VSAGYEQVEVTSRQQWRGWLAAHRATSPGVWLVTWKKGRGPYVGYDEIVDEAICFGWVDSPGSGCGAGRSSWGRGARSPARRPPGIVT